jgi:hypothetical protein
MRRECMESILRGIMVQNFGLMSEMLWLSLLTLRMWGIGLHYWMFYISWNLAVPCNLAHFLWSVTTTKLKKPLTQTGLMKFTAYFIVWFSCLCNFQNIPWIVAFRSPEDGVGMCLRNVSTQLRRWLHGAETRRQQCARACVCVCVDITVITLSVQHPKVAE